MSGHLPRSVESLCWAQQLAETKSGRYERLFKDAGYGDATVRALLKGARADLHTCSFLPCCRVYFVHAWKMSVA